ncbi:MAG: PmoA family protein, partial [Planctomycetota bacterium]|nr:PmoA family protein [Planctomycetota bacterium]
RDEKILRPHFANVHAPGGTRVTRNHPPDDGSDATDHDTMHPGIWLGFGDINGVDFWRNKGRVEHRRFVEEPAVGPGRATFATESELLTPDGKSLGRLINRITLADRLGAWIILWDAEFTAVAGDLVFGDQEEMGFGARVATPFTEKNGGLLTSSTGRTTAAKTWGQPAAWCDYSGTVEGRRAGLTLMGGTGNFRESWWHNRDYGVFVANPFGREAMKQGAKSVVTARKGEQFRLVFGAVAHDTGYNPATAFEEFSELAKQPPVATP